MVSRVVSVLIGLALCVALSSPALAQATTRSGKASNVAGYHLVLLIADDSASGVTNPASVQGITPAVAKALKDVQQFLPFKSYRPMDSMLLRGESGGQTRLKGPENNLYTAEVRAGINGSNINVNLFIVLPIGEKPITILSTRFVMAPGETVVAGTSRLSSGGAAIVALLTAITEPGGN